MTTKKEVVEKRKSLFDSQSKRYTFKKGDKRIHAPRLCVVCGRPLSSLILNDSKYIVTHPHIRFHINKFVKVCICENVESCYRTLRQKGEISDVNGR
ncbi:hypothetical protein 000TH008_204 [Bacillus phage 000TH008]|nr:hypothetical protein 000TH008_204 [Bacillus phage 000TH008]